MLGCMAAECWAMKKPEEDKRTCSWLVNVKIDVLSSKNGYNFESVHDKKSSVALLEEKN